MPSKDNLSKDDIVIQSYARTPIGSFQGGLSTLSATDLGGVCVSQVIGRAEIHPENIDEVIMGCVLPAGLGQAPARQAALNGGLPYSAGAVTVNKMCGSGLYAVMLAHDHIRAGTHATMIAGGMESMTNAPYLLPKARSGYRMGHERVVDHMFFDGLEDVYDNGKLMGVFAEQCAGHYEFSREEQDAFAIRSLSRAQNAIKDGAFVKEIAGISIESRKGTININDDEQPGKGDADKIPLLKPAFHPKGTVTAANASSISDGAAAVLLTTLEKAEQNGMRPAARIVGHAIHAQEPKWFTTAPVGALKTLSEKTGWDLKDVDLFEINEAFAVVPMAVMHDLDLPADKVNVHGGACALGHPIGASGARVLCTLLAAMDVHDVKKGMAALCLGGGEAVAIAVERF